MGPIRRRAARGTTGGRAFGGARYAVPFVWEACSHSSGRGSAGSGFSRGCCVRGRGEAPGSSRVSYMCAGGGVESPKPVRRPKVMPRSWGARRSCRARGARSARKRARGAEPRLAPPACASLEAPAGHARPHGAVPRSCEHGQASAPSGRVVPDRAAGAGAGWYRTNRACRARYASGVTPARPKPVRPLNTTRPRGRPHVPERRSTTAARVGTRLRPRAWDSPGAALRPRGRRARRRPWPGGRTARRGPSGSGCGARLSALRPAAIQAATP